MFLYATYKGSTLAENIRYLMYKYDITINDWHQSLNYVIKKSLCI